MKRLLNLLTFINKLGIGVVFSSPLLSGDKEGTPAMNSMEIETKKYTIHLHENLTYAPPEVLRVFLAHELAHTLRGDQIIAMEKNLDEECWGIAADSAINNPEDVAIAEGYLTYLKDKSILYDRLKMIPELELPFYNPGTMKVYQSLLKAGKGGNGSKNDRRFVRLMKPEHARLNLVARELLKTADEDLKDLFSRIGGIQSFRPDTLLSKGEYKPEALLSIERILDIIDGVDGATRFTRTWARPPRGGYQQGLSIKGASYTPRPKVAFLIDLSGSMTSYAPALAALSDALSERYDPVVIAHDEEVLFEGPVLPTHLNWGGGTVFLPAYERAWANSPDIIIHATDAECADSISVTTRGAPVIWVLPTAYYNEFRTPTETHFRIDAGF